MKNKLKTIEELTAIARELHSNGKKIVTTAGCFDILHSGHIALLEYSRSLGDVLIVFVNSDSLIKEIKGDKHPIICQENRIKVLAALEPVDYICVFSREDPVYYLEKIKTDFHVKGKETEKEIMKSISETISRWDGRYIWFGTEKGESTTDIINIIRERYSSD